MNKIGILTTVARIPSPIGDGMNCTFEHVCSNFIKKIAKNTCSDTIAGVRNIRPTPNRLQAESSWSFRLIFRIGPIAVGLDERHEPIERLLLRDILLHHRAPLVRVIRPGAAPT